MGGWGASVLSPWRRVRARGSGRNSAHHPVGGSACVLTSNACAHVHGPGVTKLSPRENHAGRTPSESVRSARAHRRPGILSPCPSRAACPPARPSASPSASSPPSPSRGLSRPPAPLYEYAPPPLQCAWGTGPSHSVCTNGRSAEWTAFGGARKLDAAWTSSSCQRARFNAPTTSSAPSHPNNAFPGGGTQRPGPRSRDRPSTSTRRTLHFRRHR